jgi:hypothetical protein
MLGSIVGSGLGSFEGIVLGLEDSLGLTDTGGTFGKSSGRRVYEWIWLASSRKEDTARSPDVFRAVHGASIIKEPKHRKSNHVL